MLSMRNSGARARWIVVANHTMAQILEVTSFKLVPKLREKLSAPFDPPADPQKNNSPRKENHRQQFAKRVAELLERSHRELVLIVEPHFLGLLRGHMSPALARSVVKVVEKDVAHLSTAKVAAYAKEYAY